MDRRPVLSPASTLAAIPQTDPPPFDVCGPLPEPGITLLEASAGTGKTFTVASLVTRLVAEGRCQLSEILAVTFTRMATGELRDRVRTRLASAEAGLASVLDGGNRPSAADRVLDLLANGDRAQVQTYHRRLADALAAFDEATITTTHGFCHLMLVGLGATGNLAPGAVVTEDPDGLIEEVVDDLFLRRLLRHGRLPFSKKQAASVVRVAMGNPGAILDPQPSESPSGLLRRFAERAQVETSRRLLEANLLTYDDLLIRLRGWIANPAAGEAACRFLRDRYRVVLVDEFQDTDPMQWDIVKKAFGSGHTTLVLIGDPKQAIYAFRGADVYAYLEAARRARRRFTLIENWRSDQPLLRAYDLLLQPLLLGHTDIRYRTVRATPAHEAAGLVGAPVNAALRTRVVFSEDHGFPLTERTRYPRKPAVVEWVARDLARDIVALLGSGATLVNRDTGQERLEGRGLLPGDVAVLVRQNTQALKVQRALIAAGVPAVVSSTDSVFATSGARHWLLLLEALEQPADRARVAAVALTPFLGVAAEQLVAAEEGLWEELHSSLQLWADIMRRRGVASLMRAITVSGGLTSQLLELDTGERELTDLTHVAELLHVEASANQLAVPALRAWLADRISQAGEEGTQAEERSRRTDSDAEAVQVLTIHRAKGLEFPIVYCPYLWDPAGGSANHGPVIFHDPDQGQRHLDVGGEDTASYRNHCKLSLAEQRGEDLRLLYVALTRAKHQAVIWWAKTSHCHQSPLGRLLTARSGDGHIKTGDGYVPKDEQIWKELTGRSRGSGCISIERCARLPPALPRLVPSPETPAPKAAPDLEAARLGRIIDLRWRRISYSSLTATYHEEASVGSEPEDPLVTDEPDIESAPTPASAPAVGGASDHEARLRSTLCLLAGLRGGTEVGTFVHRVLERVDFSAPDLHAELATAIAGEHGRRPVRLEGDRSTDLESGPREEGRTRGQASLPAGLPASSAVTSLSDQAAAPPPGTQADPSHPSPAQEPASMLAEGLAAAIETPLGDLTGGLRLRDLVRNDRLDELGFELPIIGGDQPRGDLATGDIARLVTRHLGPGDSLHGYARRLADPILANELRGYLTGSLDLVFRLRRERRAPRFYVVDYKTNWLGEVGVPLSAWHYRPAALAVEMQRAHYPLQALLYLVALHRYLRWRLPGYDPEENLGGVLYLFLRGMLGPATPIVDGQPCGVFPWKVPPDLVANLSDLIDRGAAQEDRP